MTATNKLARREGLFREVNEQIANRSGLHSETSFQLFICECSDLTCAEALELTAEEYEAVRAHPTRFLVKPGHQLAGIERVVTENSRYLIVEKIGPAAEIAEADDPRQR